MLLRAFCVHRKTLLTALFVLSLTTGVLEGAFIWIAKSAVGGGAWKSGSAPLLLAAIVSLRSLAQIAAARLEVRGLFSWLREQRVRLLEAASARAFPAYREPWRNTLVTCLGDGLDEAGRGIGAGFRCLAALAHAAVLAPLLLLFSWRLALGALLLAVPAMLVSRLRTGVLSAAGKRWSESRAGLAAGAEAFAEGLESRSGNGRLTESAAALSRGMDGHAAHARAWETSKAVFPPALEWFFFLALAALALMAGAVGGSGKAGPAELLPFGALLLLIYRPMREWARNYPVYLLGAQSWVRLRAARDAMECFPLRAPFPVSGGALALTGIRFGYGGPGGTPGRPVFAGLDLRLDPGAFTWIAGRNGAGKTTLLKLLAGIEFPQAGGIHLPPTWPDRERPFAYLPQKAWLEPDWRGWAGDFRAGHPGKWTSLDGILGLERILEKAGDGPLQGLSGGERQRLCLARVFASPAPYLLLDEPTTWLAAADRERILGDLLGFWREGARARGGALVSHEPFIGEFCSRTVDLEAVCANAAMP